MSKHPWSYYRWPIGIALFLLTIMAASTWVMVIALRVNRDLIEENPYEKGLKHQEVIDQAALIQTLGWTVGVSVAGHGPEKQLEISIKDNQGALIQGARVTVHAIRPSTAALDQNLELLPHGGIYSTAIPEMSGLYLLRGFIDYRGMRLRFERQISLN